MRQIHKKWFKAGLLVLAAVFGMASCSDDHFDLNSSNATENLWQNLEQTGQTNDFIKILERTIVNKKTYGIPATITYKDLLNSSRVFTVWAPVDGSYDAQEWIALLDQRDQAADDAEYTKLNERVEKQFVRNHIAAFNHNGAYNAVPDGRLRTLNSKYAYYNIAENTFNGVAISSDPKYKNIAATNGTIHLLTGGASPYQATLREVIEFTPELSDMYQYILDKDTLVFIEGLSTPGSTVNGQIQYVDSFFVESNRILPGIAMNEDSLSAAIMPSNTAWAEAVEKISQFYNYKEKYPYYDDDQAKWFTDSIRADSLKTLRTMNVIFNNMFYSLHEQVGFDWENATKESVKTFFETADSLVSTNYYNANYDRHQHAPDCNTLTEGKTPVEGSNGFAFITDHFNFKANKAWQYDIKIEAENTYYLNTVRSKQLPSSGDLGRGVRHAVTDNNRHDSISGSVSGYAYQEFRGVNATTNPTVAFNLNSVLSGTYDIYVVIVPENMVDPSNNNPKYNYFSAMLEYDFDETGKASSITAEENFQNDLSKVDTILLFENFKFPYSYYGMSGQAPVLSLTSQVTVRNRTTQTSYLNIDCFILKGKDE